MKDFQMYHVSCAHLERQIIAGCARHIAKPGAPDEMGIHDEVEM
jgi:hypothetical protein